MNPEVGTIIDLSVMKIAGGVSEHGAAFAQGTIGLIASVLSMAAKEYDRGADIRFAENNQIRALFAELAPRVHDAALRARLVAAAAAKDESLRISALNESNYALRRLLTALQIDAEEHGAREAERRIWAVLKDLAARRLVQLGP
jgi:VIT1/CCC1 family predicted Fe2+/Mn2+ transporter